MNRACALGCNSACINPLDHSNMHSQSAKKHNPALSNATSNIVHMDVFLHLCKTQLLVCTYCLHRICQESKKFNFVPPHILALASTTLMYRRITFPTLPPLYNSEAHLDKDLQGWFSSFLLAPPKALFITHVSLQLHVSSALSLWFYISKKKSWPQLCVSAHSPHETYHNVALSGNHLCQALHNMQRQYVFWVISLTSMIYQEDL